jgi:hypothetical protein
MTTEAHNSASLLAYDTLLTSQDVYVNEPRSPPCAVASPSDDSDTDNENDDAKSFVSFVCTAPNSSVPATVFLALQRGQQEVAADIYDEVAPCVCTTECAEGCEVCCAAFGPTLYQACDCFEKNCVVSSKHGLESGSSTACPSGRSSPLLLEETASRPCLEGPVVLTEFPSAEPCKFLNASPTAKQLSSERQPYLVETRGPITPSYANSGSVMHEACSQGRQQPHVSARVATTYGAAPVACTNGHPLLREAGYHLSWMCDCCGSCNDRSRGSWRCRDCDYDLCDDCEATWKHPSVSILKSGSKVDACQISNCATCTQGHPLVSIPQEQWTGQWLCDGCGLNGTYLSNSRWRCDGCNYDLCTACMTHWQSPRRSAFQHLFYEGECYTCQPALVQVHLKPSVQLVPAC